MLGIVENLKYRMTLAFKDQGDVIYLVGDSQDDIASSEYLRRIHGVEHSPAPHFELNEELKLHKVIAGLIKDELIKSAHDVADGGLFQAVTECAIEGGHGFTLDTDPAFRKDAFLFGEAQSRVVVSVDESRTGDFEDFVREHGVGFTVLGSVDGMDVVVDGENWGDLAQWMVRHELTLAAVLEE
jgi:phosphoribosylformylglycinamidine synthase